MYTRIERVVHGQDSLTREIELEIPVSNVELWESQIHTVERMLKFLTGDLWKITLLSRTWQFSKSDEVGEKSNKYDEVSLFSGGMDSLISTINLLENKKNTLLISHAGGALTKNAQKNIVNKFDVLYPDVLHTWVDLWMMFPHDYIPEGGNDNNTRSRSFLFLFIVHAIHGQTAAEVIYTRADAQKEFMRFATFTRMQSTLREAAIAILFPFSSILFQSTMRLLP